MKTHNISFDKVRIFNKQVIFAEYSKDKTFSKIFDASGKNIVNRISYKPIKTFEGDKVVISRKNQYELPSNKIVFETIKRVYDKAGKLISHQKFIQ